MGILEKLPFKKSQERQVAREDLAQQAEAKMRAIGSISIDTDLIRNRTFSAEFRRGFPPIDTSERSAEILKFIGLLGPSVEKLQELVGNKEEAERVLTQPENIRDLRILTMLLNPTMLSIEQNMSDKSFKLFARMVEKRMFPPSLLSDQEIHRQWQTYSDSSAPSAFKDFMEECLDRREGKILVKKKINFKQIRGNLTKKYPSPQN